MVDYYASHMGPDVVVMAIGARAARELAFVLDTELNMARKFSKLYRNSVTTKGPGAGRPQRWIGWIVDRHVPGGPDARGRKLPSHCV